MNARTQIDMAPIDAALPPVASYCDWLNREHGKRHVVITIPEGSKAHSMGFRFTTCAVDELAVYQAGGAVQVAGVEA